MPGLMMDRALLIASLIDRAAGSRNVTGAGDGVSL